MIERVLWNETQLDEQRLEALRRFIAWRRESQAVEYRREFDACVGQVERLFQATDDLARFTPATLFEPPVVDIARFLAVPPWSQDDLETVSGTSVAGRRRLNVALLHAILPVLESGWDPTRFPWLDTGQPPTAAERDVAIRWTASIGAIERMRTLTRMVGSRRQQAAVEELLRDEHYTKHVVREITAIHHLPVAHYSAGTQVAGIQADVAIRLSDDRLLVVECKVSNSSVNSVKRLLREAGGKAARLTAALGETVIPAVVLSGVYKLRNLVQAQNRYGLSVFWEHDLGRFRDFVRSAREVC